VHILTTRCTGNIAIGNLHQFLPAILKLVQSDAKKRLLSLHALKEVSCHYLVPKILANSPYCTKVVTNCSQGQLEGVADLLWVPLFENSDNSEETTRNVAAACLGKLTTTHPSRYLPQLHVRHP
jgi:cullin-associated NEDD8-dissociated protein 1